MPWREVDERESGFEHRRQAKVCCVCKKIILRTDDLVKTKDGRTYCAACAAAKGD